MVYGTVVSYTLVRDVQAIYLTGHTLQVLGFLVLLSGSSLYNELIRICLPKPDSSEDDIQVSQDELFLASVDGMQPDKLMSWQQVNSSTHVASAAGTNEADCPVVFISFLFFPLTDSDS